MRAEPGKRYAQVVGGVCRWRFDITTLPEWHDAAFLAVDITALNPEPGEGDLYNGSVFSKPPAPPPPAPQKTLADEIVDLSLGDRARIRVALGL
jgi:hypothetical protein